MSITIIPRRLDPPARPAWITRRVGLAALLVAEGALLSQRFRVPAGAADGPWWAWPLAHARALMIPGLLAAAATAALAGSRRFRGAPGRADRRPGVGWGGIAAHLVAFGAFVAATAQVCDGAGPAARWPAAGVLGWYGAGLALLITWLAALHPAGWRGLLGRRELGAGAAGVAVGAAAFASSQLAGQLWGPMAQATLVVVRGCLSLVASGVVCDPGRALIGVDGFAVVIAPACSGYEGIGLVWAFLAVYLIGSRRSLRWPAAWWLIPLGTVAIWLANSARITALVLLGAWVSPAVALGGFHSQAGSLAILAISLGLVALSRRARCFAADRGGAAAGDDAADAAVVANPTAAYLVPFLAVVATTMITGAFAAGFDALYPLRIGAGAAALWSFRRAYPGGWFAGSWFAVGVGVAVFALWAVLEPANPAGSATLRARQAGLPPAWGWTWLACRVVGSAVVVPLVEELAFRGYLTRRLIAADFEAVPPGRFTWFSFLASSAAFGLLHGRWFAGMLAGLIYAGVYYRRGRVGEAALAHAVTNGLIAATVLATGDWTMWS